jgi:selenide,water dikinase
MLAQVLRRLPIRNDPRLLVGAATGDDAGVYRLGRNSALVQTVDFFTPIVDDPFAYGQIAAANALSDVYAMGGRPLTAMNLLAVPVDKVSTGDIARILRGGALKVREAGCALVGGHTIKNPEPVYGLSVTGLVDPRRVTTNANARAGDLLVLTKPLGTGVATTGIKRRLTSAKLERRAVAVMKQLNTAGAELAERGLVRAATDVTGFGLLGHLASMCRASGVGAEIEAAAVPALSPEVFDLIARDCVPGGTLDNLQACEACVTWEGVPEARRILLADAQTSGGLLLCVPPKKLDAVRKVLKRHATAAAAVVGTIVRSKEARITVRS